MQYGWPEVNQTLFGDNNFFKNTGCLNCQQKLLESKMKVVLFLNSDGRGLALNVYFVGWEYATLDMGVNVIQQMSSLILGAYGQVGQQLIRVLASRVPAPLVCADIRGPPASITEHIIHEKIDALDKASLYNLLSKHQIKEVYCLAALLSASGEVNPLLTEQINMKTLFNCLEAAREGKIQKIFWPSSIAAFGTNSPKVTPQFTIMEPSTVYGITKKSGELWCSYYNKRYGVDVRSLRYPGLVGYRSPPGGGTTDYAVSIFHSAILGQPFECYLKQDTPLPMVYTDDAIDGTIQLMNAPKESIRIRTSYNLQGMTFTPKEIASEIRKFRPNFKITYKIDPLRQGIAQSWPHELQDAEARRDWGWKPKYNLTSMTQEILAKLTPDLITNMK